MSRLVIPSLCCFLTIHDQIEYIICILFPICWEKWHYISRMAFSLHQIARFINPLLFNEHTRLPVLLNIVLHVLVLCRVFFLLEILLLSENLIRQRDFLARCRTVGDLLWLELFVSFKEEPLVHIDLNVSFPVVKGIIVIFIGVSIYILLISNNVFICSGDVFVIARRHEFFKIKLVCFRHFWRFLHVATIRGEVRILTNDAIVLGTFDIFVRVLVLKLR